MMLNVYRARENRSYFTVWVPIWALFALVAAIGSSGCSDDPVADGDLDADVASDTADSDASRDITFDDVATDAAEDATDDSEADAEEDTSALIDVPADISVEDEGIFPPDADGTCADGGDGARGVIQFDDGEPLVGGLVALLGDGFKHLGFTDEAGEFFIQAPCGALVVEVATFESDNWPIHPSIWGHVVGAFDASQGEAVFEIALVTVDGLIQDVEDNPIEDAILEAELEDGDFRVFNQNVADEDGVFSVNLIPWPNELYDLTARGPEDSDKRYRSATVSVIIIDPPPEDTTFTLFEDRCEVIGTVHTSEGTALDWLYIRAEGAPYPDGADVYFSFEDGIYYPQGQSANIIENIPLWCGNQSLRLWNAIWVNPDWPCKDLDFTDQLCLNNYPFWIDQDHDEVLADGLEIEVVRVGGTVTDEFGLEQSDVLVHFEARYQWGDTSAQTLVVFNDAETNDDGVYSFVLLPLEGVEYSVRARIRDDDRRPLGEFEGSVEVTETSSYDFAMPEAPPRCVMTGTVHSSEGQDFDEIQVYFWGYDPESGDPLYVSTPWRFFGPESGTWFRTSSPDDVVPFIPFLCGEHDVYLHSIDYDTCNGSPDQICFKSWRWWNDELFDVPFDGIEIPVVHLSGYVTTESGDPVAGASVSALAGSPPFTFVTNGTGTGPDGLYDFVVLPGMEWQISVSVGDDHPMNLEATGGAVVVEEALELNFVMPDGPDRCPFSGIIRTSDGVELESVGVLIWGPPFYGMFGWEFLSIEPGIYFRAPSGPELDAIPLICAEQDDGTFAQSMALVSDTRASLPNCSEPDKFDQPCLDLNVWNSVLLEEPHTDGIEIPVVTLSGRVTTDGTDPIANANVVVGGPIYEDLGGDSLTQIGYVYNFAVSRPDGTYRLVVYPSPNDESEYTITVTTPLDVDLGEIEQPAVIGADSVIDFDFSTVN